MAEKQNESELLFERYLTEHALHFAHHPNIAGKNKRMDYLVHFDDSGILFEVKEFRESPGSILWGVHPPEVIDPYKRIYTKLEDSVPQLAEYQEYCCSVVLYNDSPAPVVLTPALVLGAMLGTLSHAVDLE